MRRDKRAFAGGAAVLGFAHLSFLLMILGPWVENPLGKWLDSRALSKARVRIEQMRKGDFTVEVRDAAGRPVPGVRVEFTQTGHDFIFGGNLFGFESFTPEENLLYLERFKEIFNLAVLPFYWSRYEPEPADYPTDDRLSAMLDWCEQNHIRAKGHPLVWRNPAGYPAWLPADDKLVTSLMEARIKKVVSRYSARIKIWDVVNEPTHLPGFGRTDVAGYVEDAFRWAAMADEDALFTINDYGILGHDFGSGPYHRLIAGLIERGAPVRAIGLQGREPRTDWVHAYEALATLDGYSDLGLPIHITELETPSGGLPITNSWKKGVWTEEAQAEYLERLYTVLFSHPSVHAIIYWDLYDADSWIREGGLIAAPFRPKEAYGRLSRLINQEWKTKGETMTDGDGRFQFRGFYGSYRVTLTESGEIFDIEASRDRSAIIIKRR